MDKYPLFYNSALHLFLDLNAGLQSHPESWPSLLAQITNIFPASFLWFLRLLPSIYMSAAYSLLCVCVLATQSCLTLCNPMDCNGPGSSVHETLQARFTEENSHSHLQGIFPTQGSNLDLLHCRQILYHLSHQGM